MDERPTKQTAEAKLQLVADKIGYPDHWRDYSTLTIVRGDALGNALRAADFENKRELNKIGKPVDRGEWIMTPATVDAYYNPIDERHQLSRGNSAVAVLRSGRNRRGELRPHRRYCRSRADARFRR